jgi:hypothetical protein
MKRMLWVTAMLLLPWTLLAQDLGDVGGFLGGDVGGLLNIPAPRGDAPGRGAPPAARGAQPPRGGQPAAAPVDRLAGLREMLTKSGAPLTAQQEASLNVLLDTEIPAMRQTLQARILELQRVRTAAQPGSAPPAAPGQRGLPPNLPSPDELLPDLNRLNDQLVAKLAAAPTLTPDQQALIQKALKDQIRSRGGFDALNLTMEDAGAAFSPEQAAQIQALFREQTQLRAQVQPPDPARLSQIERETLVKVLRLLNPAQRAALSK